MTETTTATATSSTTTRKKEDPHKDSSVENNNNMDGDGDVVDDIVLPAVVHGDEGGGGDGGNDEEAPPSSKPESSSKNHHHYSHNHHHTKKKFTITKMKHILKDEFNFIIPTIHGEKHHVQEKHGHDSWQHTILEILHHHTFQKFLILLLVIDVMLLFIEIYLSSTHPSCDIITRDCISCCPTIETMTTTTSMEATSGGEGETDSAGARHLLRRFLAEVVAGSSSGHSTTALSDEAHESSHETHSFCDSGYIESTESASVTCDVHKWSNIHTIEDIFSYLTLAILGIFMVELNLQMIIIGPIIFCKQFFFALDYIIVVISFVLEVIKRLLPQEIVASILEILIFSRIWRFIRVGHGIAEITAETTHEHYEKHHSASHAELLKYTEQLELLLKEHDIPLPEGYENIKHSNSSSSHGGGSSSIHGSGGK